jgi:hypothetical protein
MHFTPLERADALSLSIVFSFANQLSVYWFSLDSTRLGHWASNHFTVGHFLKVAHVQRTHALWRVAREGNGRGSKIGETGGLLTPEKRGGAMVVASEKRGK